MKAVVEPFSLSMRLLDAPILETRHHRSARRWRPEMLAVDVSGDTATTVWLSGRVLRRDDEPYSAQEFESWRWRLTSPWPNTPAIAWMSWQADSDVPECAREAMSVLMGRFPWLRLPDASAMEYGTCERCLGDIRRPPGGAWSHMNWRDERADHLAWPQQERGRG